MWPCAEKCVHRGAQRTPRQDRQAECVIRAKGGSERRNGPQECAMSPPGITAKDRSRRGLCHSTDSSSPVPALRKGGSAWSRRSRRGDVSLPFPTAAAHHPRLSCSCVCLSSDRKSTATSGLQRRPPAVGLGHHIPLHTLV